MVPPSVARAGRVAGGASPHRTVRGPGGYGVFGAVVPSQAW